MKNVVVKVDHNFHPEDTEEFKLWKASRSDDYKKYRHDWSDLPINFIVSKVPLHLDIEATSNCNLLCTMCARTTMVDDGTFWKVEEFDLNKYKDIIDECSSKGTKSVKYNYLGEPLMNKKIYLK